MNKQEFMDWLKHHVDRFPKLKGYFVNQTGDNRIEEDWRKALGTFEAVDLYAATERMTRIEKTIWEAEHKPKLLRFAFESRRGRRLVDAAPANSCLLYTSPSPRDRTRSRMPSSA